MIRGALIVLLMWATASWAAPTSSKRPVQRGGNVIVPVEVAPSGAIQPPTGDAQTQNARKPKRGIGFSLRPFFRPRKVEKQARAQRQLQAKGAVCGDPAIQGELIGRVKGKLNGCGVEKAVRVRSVSGVTLSQSSVMDCVTANALKSWVNKSAKPALSRKGGGLKGLRVAAHYACRTRNNQKGAKISEHGRGRAIDISAFRLADGSEVSVLKGWNARSTSKAMRQMHKGACGPFGTVLGPNANRFHLDHFHFDTARYRSGRYCK
ncbi:MAG: extensin-like domain-containing protein [Sulfitobacter sp.]